MAEKGAEFVWTRDISVGDDTLDAQHQTIFDATNRLLRIVTGEEPIENTEEALRLIEGYIRDHFSYEEAYMEQHGYPETDISRHRSIHAAFVEDFGKRRTRALSDGKSESLILDLENILGAWLVRHVSEEDQKYARFIRERRGMGESPAHDPLRIGL